MFQGTLRELEAAKRRINLLEATLRAVGVPTVGPCEPHESLDEGQQQEMRLTIENDGEGQQEASLMMMMIAQEQQKENVAVREGMGTGNEGRNSCEGLRSIDRPSISNSHVNSSEFVESSWLGCASDWNATLGQLEADRGGEVLSGGANLSNSCHNTPGQVVFETGGTLEFPNASEQHPRKRRQPQGLLPTPGSLQQRKRQCEPQQGLLCEPPRVDSAIRGDIVEAAQEDEVLDQCMCVRGFTGVCACGGGYAQEGQDGANGTSNSVPVDSTGPLDLLWCT